MITLKTRAMHQVIPQEVDDAALNATLRRVFDPVRASDAGVLYDMTALDLGRLRRWARDTDIPDNVGIGDLARYAADAIPMGRVDALVPVDGRVMTVSVAVRVDVGRQARALQIARNGETLFAWDPARHTGGGEAATSMPAAEEGEVTDGEKNAVRVVLYCLALAGTKAIALHKVIDPLSDGRTWQRPPRISKKLRVLKPHYRRAHWRKVRRGAQQLWVFVRATIIHRHLLHDKIAADVVAPGVLYVPVREGKRRALVEDRRQPNRWFGMLDTDVVKLAGRLRLAHNRPIFAYMRALSLSLAELAYAERNAPEWMRLISLDHALRVLDHRLLSGAAE